MIVGGGVVGLAIARELRRRFADQSVTVIDKEASCGVHQSGRNSGVLHAGFYYSPDSLKARFCRDGNVWWQAFCRERGIRLRDCGKFVVARNEVEAERMADLQRRATANGVPTELVDERAAREREPLLSAPCGALWSPTTATVDPIEALAALRLDVLDAGGRIDLSTAYIGRTGDGGVLTSQGVYRPGFVVNAAGLYADRVAADFGAGTAYRMQPFKGLYLYPRSNGVPLRTHVYPVPDPSLPFLGVHWTVTVDGIAKIGPTALPAWWREQYRWRGFKLGEWLGVMAGMTAILRHGGLPFLRYVAIELRKQSSRYLADQASLLLCGADVAGYRVWGKPGIRAQLAERKTGKLISDFVVENADRSLHVLNAVSPAFTSAIPFARHVVDRLADG